MRHYDVVIHRGSSGQGHHRVSVDAPSPAEAVVLARSQTQGAPEADLYAVYRRRRAGRGRLVASFPGSGGGDGLAGVREPRRPLPDPGHLQAQRDVEA
jgi:hypothetical protein